MNQEVGRCVVLDAACFALGVSAPRHHASFCVSRVSVSRVSLCRCVSRSGHVSVLVCSSARLVCECVYNVKCVCGASLLSALNTPLDLDLWVEVWRRARVFQEGVCGCVCRVTAPAWVRDTLRPTSRPASPPGALLLTPGVLLRFRETPSPTNTRPRHRRSVRRP